MFPDKHQGKNGKENEGITSCSKSGQSTQNLHKLQNPPEAYGSMAFSSKKSISATEFVTELKLTLVLLSCNII